MDLRLDEAQRILVGTFSDLLAKECGPAHVRECEAAGFSRGLWARYCELGAHAMGLPESAGGLGMSLLELGLVAALSGRALAPLPFVEVATAGRLLARVAPADPLLGAIAAGEPAASLAIPRPHAVLATSRTRGGRRLVPYGAVTGAVLALEGATLLAVEAAGARRSGRLRDLGAGALAEWDAAAAAGARALASGAAATQAMARAAAEWKLLTAFFLTGLAQRALEIGADYARERIQFGVPIGAFQAIAHPLAECATRVDGAELLCWEAAWADDEEPARFEELAAMAFAWAAQTALRTADVSLHTHGGYGFSSEYDIQLYYRRARALASIGGGAREELQSVAELCFGARAAGSSAGGA